MSNITNSCGAQKRRVGFKPKALNFSALARDIDAGFCYFTNKRPVPSMALPRSHKAKP